MYQYLIVVLNIGNSTEEIIQEFGVRQGDKMTTVLFIFLWPILRKYRKIFENRMY